MARNFSSTLSSGTCLPEIGNSSVSADLLLCFNKRNSECLRTTTHTWKEMPAVAAVERDISGQSTDDARLRQIGAFGWQLNG